MLRSFALWLTALCLGFGLAWSAAAPKKKTAAKAPPSKAPAGKTAARKTPAAKGTTAARNRNAPTNRARTTTYARGRTRGRSPQPVATRRYYGQQTPTADRNMEIQQALATRGYLQATPSGTWDAASADALKRFQEEQNLPPTGKITSLSLIALGLGPKRNPITANATQQPVP
ncbi:MAG: peptidoglycan-binding protein [Acidobacteria bacterium]|nr:peptidoglycan-binding protein [Acidobacteriota bacterium]